MTMRFTLRTLQTNAEISPGTGSIHDCSLERTDAGMRNKSGASFRPLEDHPGWRRGRKVDLDKRRVLFDFPLDCIQSVIFGACISPDTRQQIINACEGTSIRVLQQAMIARHERDGRGRQGVIKLVPIDDTRVLHGLSDVGIMCDDIPDEAFEPEVSIGGLSELPYYQGNEKWVKRYYRRAKSAGL